MSAMEDLFGADSDSDSDNDNDNDNEETSTDKEIRKTSVQQQHLQRPANAGVLTFHNGTEEALYLHVKRSAMPGNSSSVLNAIDNFCYHRHWMMHLGDKKLPYLYEAIDLSYELNDGKPLRVVELGSYCGYSAISILSKIRAVDTLTCVENHPDCVRWTTQMVQFAHPHATNFRVIHCDAKDCSAYNSTTEGQIDLLFIDHAKQEYLPALQAIIQHDLLHTNSIVVADNVLYGEPLTKYLSFVRDSNGRFKSSRLVQCQIEYAGNAKDEAVATLENSENEDHLQDGMEISIFR